MKLYAYFLQTPYSAGELAKRLPKQTLALRPSLACLPRFLSYTLSQSFKGFHEGRPLANKFEVDWLCRLAASPQHAQAIAFCTYSQVAGIVSPRPLSPARLRQWGTPVPYAFDASAQAELAGKYGISSAALSLHPLEDLLIEASAVAFL